MTAIVTMSSTSTPPDPPPPKPPFDVVRAAMLLLALMIATPALLVLITTVRCAVAFIPECIDRPWPTLFRDWLGETIPVLVAIVMAYRLPPPRQ
jgi:hypothetical protein